MLDSHDLDQYFLDKIEEKDQTEKDGDYVWNGNKWEFV
jgi:hypothetical protein